MVELLRIQRVRTSRYIQSRRDLLGIGYGTPMPTYITLIRWTNEGIRKVKESPARYDTYKKTAEKLGCTPKAFYLVTGQYDLVAIVDAPDDMSATKLALATAARGSVRTETLRASTEQEYRKIISELP